MLLNLIVLRAGSARLRFRASCSARVPRVSFCDCGCYCYCYYYYHYYYYCYCYCYYY